MSKWFENAEWIWNGARDSENLYSDYYAEINAKNGAEYTMYISADSDYAVYINGIYREGGQYPDYPDFKIYDTLAMTPWLKPGINTVKIMAYCQNEDSFSYRKEAPGIIFSVWEINGSSVASVVNSGVGTPSAINSQYISRGIPKMTWQLSYSFEYDSDIPGAEPKPENTSIVSDLCKKDTLFPRPVKKLVTGKNKSVLLAARGTINDLSPDNPDWGERMQRAALGCLPLTGGRAFPSEEGTEFTASPLEGTGKTGQYLLFDLGEESVGLFVFEAEFYEKCEVLIGWGEHLDDLRPRTSVGGRCFAAKYTAHTGFNSFIHPFKRIGLRYLMLYIYSGRIKLHYAGIRPTDYPMDMSPYFECADSMHNRIYKTCVRTLLMSVHTHYEDCPWREQSLYTMDSRNQMLAGYYAFGEYDMPRESIRLIAMSLRDDALLELCSPARIYVTIPSFSAVFILQLYEYLLFSGDKKFAADMLGVCETIAKGFLAQTDKSYGLIKCYNDPNIWNFYEWQTGLSGDMRGFPKELETYDAPMCGFVSLAYHALSELYRLTSGIDGNHESEKRCSFWKREHEKLNENTNKAFYCDEKRIYCSYINIKSGEKSHFCELTQSLLVCCGAVPVEKLKEILNILSGGGLIKATLSHSIFKFDALMKMPEVYGRRVFTEVESIWGDMLCRGATTFWETQEGADAFGYAGSLCHGWSAIPAYLYFRYALGLYPSTEGDGRIDHNPVSCGLHDARGMMRTSKGENPEVLSDFKVSKIYK
ncbi:MAG: hypothetical protein VB118_09255 [Oscillospiraceae bacterium]|nr:hypothetical protein [Oscillospiraceae bacterium]